MKLVMFSVYDTKAEAFLQPFFSLSRGTAMREFSEAANQPDHQFFRHAADYHLFELGTFDQVKGEVELSAPKVELGNALMFRQPDLPEELPSK